MIVNREVGRLIIELAEYYDKQLTANQIDMYVRDLSDIPMQDLYRAVDLYRRDPKNERFPLPAKLRGMIQLPDDQKARDAVGRILTAISRIGPYRDKDAQDYVGELGWAVVKQQGGWEEVCQTLTNDNKGTLMAQWRELAISLMNKERLGFGNEAPSLGFKPKKPGQLEGLAGLIELPKRSD